MAILCCSLFLSEPVGHLRVAKERHAPQSEPVVTIRQATRDSAAHCYSGRNDLEELSRSTEMSPRADHAENRSCALNLKSDAQRKLFLFDVELRNDARFDGQTQFFGTSVPSGLISGLERHHHMEIISQKQRHVG